MGTLGWSLTGLGIWAFVSLALPLVISLFDRPKDGEDARLLVGLSWLWPVLGPLLMVVILIAAPCIGFGKYSDWLAEPKSGKEEKPLEGRIVGE